MRHPSLTHPHEVDASVGVFNGELDGFAEHGHVAPRQDGRFPPAEAHAPLHGAVRVVRCLVAHAPCGEVGGRATFWGQAVGWGGGGVI